MRIAICDDEELIRQQIWELAIQEDKDCSVDEYATGDALLDSKEDYHLVFLDIQMPGVDGVEAARRLRAQGRAICIVFVTGTKEYVFDAFGVGALHYLLKPIGPEKFRAVFERARGECQRVIQLEEGKSGEEYTDWVMELLHRAGELSVSTVLSVRMGERYLFWRELDVTQGPVALPGRERVLEEVERNL